MIAQSLFGFFSFAFLAWCISENRRLFPFKTVVIGLSGQVILAILLLKFPLFTRAFSLLNHAVVALQSATRDGTAFVFGYIGGGPPPFAVTDARSSFILAFQALPLILVVSALSAVLFYWRVLPVIVKGFSLVLEKAMGLGGAEGLGVSANIFVGMVEAPLLIRPYVEKMTRSELFTLMTSGMATIAGTVMVLYAGILSDRIPGVMGQILTASIISAPAAVVISKIMIPETRSVTSARLDAGGQYAGAMDALTKGTGQGIELMISIIGMIIVLVALVSLGNGVLGLFPDVLGRPLTLQRILGWIMAPVAWLTGIPLKECPVAGSLLGVKTVLNEFIAYIQLSRLPAGALSPRSMLILTYAMCGFANPGSLGIMIGGLGAMAPSRRNEVAALGLRSIVAGTLATCMTGAVAGMLTG